MSVFRLPTDFHFEHKTAKLTNQKTTKYNNPIAQQQEFSAKTLHLVKVKSEFSIIFFVCFVVD